MKITIQGKLLVVLSRLLIATTCLALAWLGPKHFDFICKIDIETNKTGSGSPELLTGAAYFGGKEDRASSAGARDDPGVLVSVLKPSIILRVGTSPVLNTKLGSQEEIGIKLEIILLECARGPAAAN